MAQKTEYLSTIDTLIKVGDYFILEATDFGDIGGAPDMIEATTLRDKVQRNILGVQSQDAFEITYERNAADYANVKKCADNPQTSYAVEVYLPEEEAGKYSKFSNTGKVSQYIPGKGVGEVQTVVISIALDGDWTQEAGVAVTDSEQNNESVSG